MGVAAHLGIALEDYDRQIRTFIPYYDEMLDVVSDAVPRRARRIIDLGIGSGALAARCQSRLPKATVVGIDADPAILVQAARRLGRGVTLINDNFLRVPLQPADAVIASFSLHHVRTASAKRRMYRGVAAAVHPDGVFVTADCFPSSVPAVAHAQRRAWRAYLHRKYSPTQAAAYFRSWRREDIHFPLDIELALLRSVGLQPDVVWRRDGFAVVAGWHRRGHRDGAGRRKRRESVIDDVVLSRP